MKSYVCMPRSALTTLDTSFITSKVDYCNVALADLPQCDLDRVQSVVNAAARLTADACKYDHVAPLLKELHWLLDHHNQFNSSCVYSCSAVWTAQRRDTWLIWQCLSAALPVVVSGRHHLPTLSCHPHVPQLSAIERLPSLVQKPGTVYRLLFIRPRHHTVPSKDIWNNSCLDNLSVCDNVRTDYDSALVAVCTAYCALQIVMFTLHYITMAGNPLSALTLLVGDSKCLQHNLTSNDLQNNRPLKQKTSI